MAFSIVLATLFQFAVAAQALSFLQAGMKRVHMDMSPEKSPFNPGAVNLEELFLHDDLDWQVVRKCALVVYIGHIFTIEYVKSLNLDDEALADLWKPIVWDLHNVNLSI